MSTPRDSNPVSEPWNVSVRSPGSYCEDFSSIPDLHQFEDNISEQIPSGLVIYPFSGYLDRSPDARITVTGGAHVMTFGSSDGLGIAQTGVWFVITEFTYPLMSEVTVTIDFRLGSGPADRLRIEGRSKDVFGKDKLDSNTVTINPGTAYVRFMPGAFPYIFHNGLRGLYVRAVPVLYSNARIQDQDVHLNSICWSVS